MKGVSATHEENKREHTNMRDAADVASSVMAMHSSVRQGSESVKSRCAKRRAVLRSLPDSKRCTVL